MAEDSDELGRYTDAKEKLDTALTARHNLATELAVLANKIATGPDLDESNSDEAVVTSFDAKHALDIVGQMIEAEAEIEFGRRSDQSSCGPGRNAVYADVRFMRSVTGWR